jgi:transcriptional regulator with XRE-family HTH domain
MVMETKELGRIIRARRIVLNLTIGELSEYTGLSRTTISDIELGKTNPRLNIITEIFRFLNLEMKIEIKQVK